MKYSLSCATCVAITAAAPLHAQPAPLKAGVPVQTQPPPLKTAEPLQAAPLPGAPPADTAALGYARQIAEVMLSPERRQEITQGLTQAVMTQIRSSAVGQSSDPGLRRIMDDFLAKVPGQLRPVGERHMPWITDAMAQAYAHQYSVDELRQISEFAKTPAGAHFVARGLTVLSDPGVVRANQTFYNDALQAANVGTPQLRTSILDYLNKHPDVARQVQAQAQAQQQKGQQPQQGKPPR
jgi:hypothetical protein